MVVAAGSVIESVASDLESFVSGFDSVGAGFESVDGVVVESVTGESLVSVWVFVSGFASVSVVVIGVVVSECFS